jgi:hypothetical protein
VIKAGSIHTSPSNSKKHSNANKIYYIQVWVKGEYGIPEAKKLIERELSAKKEADPAAEYC